MWPGLELVCMRLLDGGNTLKWESVKPFKYFCNIAALRSKCTYVDTLNVCSTFVIYGMHVHQVEFDKQEQVINL